MRLTALIVLFSLVFTMAAMAAMPHFPSARLFIFPGLLLAFKMLSGLGMNLTGRASLVWTLATVFNTLIYSVMMWFSFWLVRRFRPRKPSVQV